MKKEKIAVIIVGLIAISFYLLGCGSVEQSPVTPETLSEATSKDQEIRTSLGLTVDQFEAKAEAMGMTGEEFKAYLSEQFEEKAEAMGMTVEEHKVYLAEQFKAKAEAERMTVEEYKAYLIEQKKAKYEAFKAKDG